MSPKEALNSKNKQFKERSTNDVVRIVVGCLLLGSFFYPWFQDINGWTELASNLHIVSYVAGFAIASALITHVTRRLLFPYIDLKEYALRAKQDPMASALVFFGMCIIISVTIWSAAGFFK